MVKVTCKNKREFKKELALVSGAQVFEADLNPVFVHLSNAYLNAESPKLNICFFDIEVDMQPFAYPSGHRVKLRERGTTNEVETVVYALSRYSKTPAAYDLEVFDEKQRRWVSLHSCCYLEPGLGYAPTDDPFMPITAITVHLKWLNQTITLALPPHELSESEAQALVNDIPNVQVFSDEAELLTTFLDLIDDADVLSGWNSEGFDVPYTVNRVMRVLGKEATKRFCLWNQQPKRREYEKFGKTAITYDFVGRVHLDSLELYRKYTYEERHSYRLDAIGEYEIGENKVPYEGSLDQLYNDDFRKFIEYNRQDTLLLNKLDDKLKFIDLANQLAHENTVLLQTTMGAVAVTDQAIINEAHANRHVQVPSRSSRPENIQAAGAYVAYPKAGMHDWIGSLDINSLYPSAIRALNMSPETIVGQIRPVYTDQYIHEQMTLKKKSFAAAWEGMFGTIEYDAVMSKDQTLDLIVDWVDGESTKMSGAEIFDLIFTSGQPWMITANGTIFTYEKEGVIPGLLKRWYAERKALQAELKFCLDLGKGVEIDDALASELAHAEQQSDTQPLPKLRPLEICALIDQRDVTSLQNLIATKLLAIADGKLKYFDQAYADDQEEYWDKRQLVKKINLNSLYGALLNPGCRFFDKRIGQSTTLSGRQIVKHMSAVVNELITGVKDYKGDSVIYNDTDSEIGSTLHQTNYGERTIEWLFENCSEFHTVGDKEYAYDPNLMVMSYDPELNEPYLGHINYIYRHKVSKDLYEIEDANGNVITVTEDHSVMIERDGVLQEVKPADMLETDILVSIVVGNK